MLRGEVRLERGKLVTPNGGYSFNGGVTTVGEYSALPSLLLECFYDRG